MKFIHFVSQVSNSRVFNWKLAVLLLSLVFAEAVHATQSTFQNFSVLNFTVPGNPPPQIDATNFDNENQFNISFENSGNNVQLYEPQNTVNYTNNSTGVGSGLMTANSTLFVTSLGFIEGFNGIGSGFQFDTLTSNTIPHQMAGTFDNSGTIRCDSAIDGNNVLNIGGIEFLSQSGMGQCLVWATNIICPGTIDTSVNGFIQLTGDNVDLRRSVLTIENGSGLAGNAAFGGTGVFGLNTNAWDPNANLQVPFASSAFFPITPFFLTLTNAVPFTQTDVDPATGNNIIKYVFIQDTSGSNVAYNVYFNAQRIALGGGNATIQWAGTFIDSATGQTITNYLYLNDDYVLGSSTNVAISGAGFPDNFTLTQSPTPLIAQLPAAPDVPYVNNFPIGGITNNYSFANITAASTSATNASATNPSGALTNLSARIQITASQELNLSLAQITGQTYTSLMASNQFDGNNGALIASPYSDINLGVTNGFLSISNLLESQFLDWGGNIQAWSTRWLEVNTNGGFPVTNDFRVLLVKSQLTPTTEAQIQNLTLNASNSLIISDMLNVFGKLSATPQSLTLVTNVIGTGATSPDGELNLQNMPANTWSWPGSFPNLLWLTNNGAIRAPNQFVFIGNAQTNAVTPATNAIAATGILSESGGKNVVVNSTVTIGSTPAFTYTFTNHITTKSSPYDVLIGATFDASMTNLIAAINHGTGAGKVYSANNTFSNTYVAAGVLTNNLVGTNHAFIVTANAAIIGSFGNSIPISTTAANLMWNGSFLSGGADAVAGTTNAMAFSVPYGAIINNGLLTGQGATILVTNFQSGGVISNGVGSFILTAQTAIFTNGSLTAGGDISITANTLEASNLILQAGRSLTLQVANWLTDDGVSNANFWVVGNTNGTGGNGLVLPFLPANTTPGLNNLLGTTISMSSPPPNQQVASTWAGLDYGVSTTGYTVNNVAIGQLILNSLAPSSVFYFTGTGGAGVSNAIYVDRLELENYASYTNGLGTEAIPTLQFNSNLVIYYADAIASGQDVSYQLNNSNGGHLRWVPQYMGIFSGTNVVYGNGTVNRLNIGLVKSPYLDSNGSGIPNVNSSSPVFVASELNFQCSTAINSKNKIIWDSIPGATNTVYYSTNILSANWIVLTNFVSPTNVPPVGGWPITNVLVEPYHTDGHGRPDQRGFYRVGVSPNTANLYGQ